jgi:hypothetical protein
MHFLCGKTNMNHENLDFSTPLVPLPQLFGL